MGEKQEGEGGTAMKVKTEVEERGISVHDTTVLEQRAESRGAQKGRVVQL